MIGLESCGFEAPASFAVGGTAALGAYQESCRPMFLPLSPDVIVWTSLDPGTAAVSGSTLRGLAAGAAVLQAAYGGMHQQALIVVGGSAAPPGASTPLRLRMYVAPVMRVGQRAQFGVFAEFGDGTVSQVSAAAAWTAANPAIAGFAGPGSDASRPVDAFAAGAARLTATYRGLSATMTIDVRQ
jgi:hypothetical protein